MLRNLTKEEKKQNFKQKYKYFKANTKKVLITKILSIFLLCYLELIFFLLRYDNFLIVLFNINFSDDILKTTGLFAFLGTIIYFLSCKLKNRYNSIFRRVLTDLIKSFLFWIIMFVFLFIIQFLVPDNLVLYKIFFNKEVIQNAFVTEKIINEVEYFDEEESSVDINTIKLIAEEEPYIDGYEIQLIEIISDWTKIYVEPTDIDNMYTASSGMQFKTTGRKYISAEGLKWFEFTIDENKGYCAWVKENDVRVVEKND